MADLSKTVSIIFAGKDELSVTTRKLYRELDDFGGAIKNVSGSMAGVADNILKFDAALNALAIGGLFYAYKKSIDFSSATADLNKVLGDSEKIYMKGAQEEAMKLSEKFGESSGAVLQSMANFKQAGFDLQESMSLTKNSLDLVIAGDLEAAEASEYLVSVLKGFKAPASEAGRIVDILNEVSNSYATNVKELAAGMAGISPIAKTMGFSFEETAGMITPVIEVFRSGDESARALKTGLLKLIDDSKPVADALASIGVSQKDSNGQLRSGKDILYDVAKAFETLNPNQKLFVTQQLVGIDQSARMVEVFDGLKKSTEITGVAMKAAGSAAREVAIRMAEPEVVVKRFMTGIDNLASTVGGKFKNSFTGVVEGGIEIEKTLKGLVDSNTFAPVFDYLNRFANQVRDYLLLIAQNLPGALAQIDWSSVLHSFDKLGSSIAGAFEAIFGNVDLTTVEGLRTLIQKLVDGFAALNNVTAGIIDGMRPLFSMIGAGADQFSKMSEGTADLVGNVLGMAKAFYITTTYLGPLSDGFTVVASSVYMLKAGLPLARAAMASMELSTLSLNAVLLASPLALGAFAVSAGVAAGALAQYIPGVKEAGESVGSWIYDLFHADQAQKALATTTIDATAKTEIFSDTVKNVPTIAKTDVVLAKYDEAIKNISLVKNRVDSLPSRKTTDVAVNMPTKAVVDESKIIQDAVEWKAKIDIAEIESATKQIEAAFKSVDNTITATSKATTDIIGNYTDLMEKGVYDTGLSWAIDKQMSMQEDAVRAQNDLIEAQIDLLKAKSSKLEKGESLVSIDATGLEPELEAFIWKILKKIEIRANAEASEFLLGLT